QDAIVISSGSLSVASTSVIHNDLRLTGGTLTGAGTITVTDTLTWSGGTMSGSGTTVAQGGLALSGSYRMLDGRTLENPGTATWTAGDLYLVNAAPLHNTGLIDDQAGRSLFYDGGAQSTFRNDGTFRVTGRTQPATVGIILANSDTGLIDARAGTLT